MGALARRATLSVRDNPWAAAAPRAQSHRGRPFVMFRWPDSNRRTACRVSSNDPVSHISAPVSRIIGTTAISPPTMKAPWGVPSREGKKRKDEPE